MLTMPIDHTASLYAAWRHGVKTAIGAAPARVRIAIARLREKIFLTIIMVMSETLPLADVKARLSELVERVVSEHDRVLITRRGRPAAVLMSPDDLEALEETLDLLSEPDAMEEIRRAEADLDARLGFSAAELRAKYIKG